MTSIQNLKDGLADLKAEVLAGKSVADVLASVATDYDLHPGLLQRKFIESYKSEDALRATAEAVDPEKNLAEAIEKAIQAMCRRYDVPRNAVIECKTPAGERYTVVCKIIGGNRRAIRHSDATARMLGDGFRLVRA